jgi:exopolyphosphatase / guanosine-5'-triphosphate,3'-diphosphate pyrophosphatase
VAELLALLELGSNATRCLLARIDPGIDFHILDHERVQTRLGDGEPGTLPREAIDRTLAAVHGFLDRVRNGNGLRVVAVATAAVRDAANRDRLLGPLRRHAGVDVQVLSPAEEARLGALAALRTLPVETGLLADLGGSSLQLTRVRRGTIVSTASLPLGAVGTTRRFLRHDPPAPEELRRLRQAARESLAARVPAARAGEALVGLGGTVRSVARLHLRLRGLARVTRHGLRLRQSEVTAVRERLEVLPLRGRERLAGLKRERADIIVAGAVVIEELMRLGNYLDLVVSEHGVRDGVLLRETFRRRRRP